jgi:hypothetical protein
MYYVTDKESNDVAGKKQLLILFLIKNFYKSGSIVG